MKSADWAHLSDWHNAWLAADTAERDRLRRSLQEQRPDLAGEADGLAEASHVLPVFLETPAFALAIHDLAGKSPSWPWAQASGPTASSAFWRVGAWATSIAPPTCGWNAMWR
jgi:hypothetical protein